MRSTQAEHDINVKAALRRLQSSLPTGSMGNTIREAYRKNGFIGGALSLALFLVVSAFLLALAIAVIMAVLMLNAWVLVNLWTWFVMPLGVPIIGFWHAMGIILTVRLVMSGMFFSVASDDDVKNSEKRILSALDKEAPEEPGAWKKSLVNILRYFTAPLIVYVFGAVIHSFM